MSYNDRCVMGSYVHYPFLRHPPWIVYRKANYLFTATLVKAPLSMDRSVGMSTAAMYFLEGIPMSGVVS